MRNVCYLRTFGIRTASDLLRAYEEALRRGRERAEQLHGTSCTNKTSGTDQTSGTAKVVADYQLIEVVALRKALELPDAPTGGPVPVIQAIIDTLPGEEWFAQIRNWRQSEFAAADAWYSYLDGRDWDLTHVHPLPPLVDEAKRPFVSVPVVIDLAHGGSEPAHALT